MTPVQDKDKYIPGEEREDPPIGLYKIGACSSLYHLFQHSTLRPEKLNLFFLHRRLPGFFLLKLPLFMLFCGIQVVFTRKA